ncbi:uncharacterized protein LOC110684074 [Chenopodium quinoa]|uniref:uncharacterized protein LOC110684074 n=1 Tax=Chenopodium quinoa TaxID=63459 RepID=UPI000B79A704|nr:uncharacterized protein LOC110684074 [Chenopodium quinoa]
MCTPLYKLLKFECSIFLEILCSIKVSSNPLFCDFVLSKSSYSYSQSSRDEIDGYVKGAAYYMVKDDLSITPSSTISSINLFNIHGVKDISFLLEKTVEVDGTKALELVRTAFYSNTVLTDVFMSNDQSMASTSKNEGETN